MRAIERKLFQVRLDHSGGNLQALVQPPVAITVVVAIPVNNERERIIACLDALAAQVGAPTGAVGLLLFLNNCTDGTRPIVEDWVATSRLPVRLLEQNSPSASAGWARRMAMDAAAAWLTEISSLDGILLTTDADSRVKPDWVSRNLAAIISGADAVAGRVVFDPVEIRAAAPALRQRHNLENEYAALLAEIEARLTATHGNDWPYHRMKSGASIAVRLEAYRSVGGLPDITSGEDHAFIDLLTATRYAVRYASDVVVTTSARLEGRAKGGTAETLQRWARDLDSPCEARLRRLSVVVWSILSGHPRTGRPLRPHELPRQIALAGWFLKLLRLFAAHRGDSLRTALTTPDTPKRLSTT